MGSNDQGARQGPFRVVTVRGEPYQIGTRTLIPQARVASWGRARATLGGDRAGGWGGGSVQIRPLAFIELTGDGERPIPITDATRRAWRWLLSAALAIMVGFTVIRCTASWLGRHLARN